MASNHPFIISTGNEDQQTLRDRFQEWGYLYIKNYVDADTCSTLLHSFLNVLNPYITWDNSKQLPVSNGMPFFETDTIWDEVYPKIQSLESFHSFFHTPPILDLMKTVTGKDVFVYPMKMARISTPRLTRMHTPIVPAPLWPVFG